MQKILIPFDGSESSLRALEYVLAKARNEQDVHIEVLNVQDPMPLRSLALAPERIQQVLADEAGTVLGPARRILDQAGLPYQVRARTGSAAQEIIAHCREHDCTAIVMGTRGMGPLAAAMAGSVALRVVHMAEVPVTLIK